MGTLLILLVVLVALWAMWVSYISKDIPPHVVHNEPEPPKESPAEAYQRSCDMTVNEYDKQNQPPDHWPFPKHRP